MREDENLTLEDEQVPVLLNGCFGGFSLSDKACAEYKKRQQENNPSEISNDEAEHEHYNKFDPDRFDPILIKLFEEWGSDEMSDVYSRLYLNHIPRDVYEAGFYEIREYDGSEFLSIRTADFEKHKAEQEKLTKYFELFKTLIFSKKPDSDKIQLLSVAFLDQNTFEGVGRNLNLLSNDGFHETDKKSFEMDREVVKKPSSDPEPVLSHNSIFNSVASNTSEDPKPSQSRRQSSQLR